MNTQGRREVFCIWGAQNFSNVALTLGELRMRSHAFRPRGCVTTYIRAHKSGRWWRGSVRPQAHGR